VLAWTKFAVRHGGEYSGYKRHSIVRRGLETLGRGLSIASECRETVTGGGGNAGVDQLETSRRRAYPLLSVDDYAMPVFPECY